MLFCSLVKMLFWMCKITKESPNMAQIQHAILRNFSSFDEIDTLQFFNAQNLNSAPYPDKSFYHEKYKSRLRNEFKELDHTEFYELFRKKHEEKLKEEFAVTPAPQNPDSQQQYDKYLLKKFDEHLENNDFKDQEINDKFEAKYDEYFERKFENEVIIGIEVFY